MAEIFLNENNSVLSNNVETNLNISFDNKNKLLPDESLVDDFSLFEQYLKERDECCNYRLILNINPLCSNVLFNTITEIVVNEGTDKCKCLNFLNNGLNKDTMAPNAVNTKNPIKYYDAIRDTEYSHVDAGNFKYHCGIDIFNNHMLRKKIFMHINKANYSDENGETALTVYNTIGDYLRNSKGDIIKEPMNINQANVGYDEMETERHIYTTDSLDTMKNSFYSKCHDSNGWWGFTNPGMINIDTNSSSTITTNQLLSYKKPCEFVDMYPERELFSFVPSFNKNRNRLEKNWDYCITYPFSKDYELIDKICGGKNGSIKAVVKVVTSPTGIKLLQCTSLFKHSFSSGNYVNFYYYMVNGGEIPDFINNNNIVKPLKENYYTEVTEEEEGEYKHRGTEYTEDDLSFQKYQKDIRVFSVGDLNGEHKDRIFSVKYDDIKNIYPNFCAFGCFYKKLSNNAECSYYARRFKKLMKPDGGDIISDINKTAFSRNIYGDEIAQIVFTDDIDLCGLKDENGRDVSEIYFTVVKRNAGYNEWYINNDVTNPVIEASHCFGKLTSGIDFSGVDVNEEPFDYNVHYLHNLDKGVCQIGNVVNLPAMNTFSAWGDTILADAPKFIESGITIDRDVFYGDIIEFDNYNYNSLVIGNICHRFNTGQRETFDWCFRDLKQDVISHDDYDSENFGSGFTVDTYYCNDVVNSNHSVNNSLTTSTLMYSNIMPEGYFYNPHTMIKIKEESDVKHSTAYYVNYDSCKLFFESGKIKMKVRVPIDYGFIKGDYVAIYDKTNGNVIWGCINSFIDMYMVVIFNYDYFYGLDIANHTSYFLPSNGERRYFMFWSKDSVPTYAKLSVETNSFSWRNTLKRSELNNESDIYDQPFTNGRIYIQKNINFYLKRQDPRGEYGLSMPLFKENEQKVFNVMRKYIMDGSDKVDLPVPANFNNNISSKTCY